MAPFLHHERNSVLTLSSSVCVCFFQSCLVGIVVPDPEVMPEWAKKKGIIGTYKDLCKNTVGGTKPNCCRSHSLIDAEKTGELNKICSFVNRN